ncbi:MAG: hypothetical protein KF868_04490 [Acidobacteria bacterium]|nr:hypothetical protein [Acidobacteriota bacterium]MCW5968724.1 hypothetical protein [Blastocatellales bacterium]
MGKQDARLVLNCALAVGALLGSVVLISWLLKTQSLGAPVRGALVLIPVAFYVLALVGYMRLIRLGDELQRRIHLEALAIAFPSSAVAVLACEYLRKAGFIAEFKPDYALMIMLVLWGLGFFIAWRRYQ